MKSFWASVCIFSALVGLIIWNSCYIHRVCEELTATAEALPACDKEGQTISALTDLWERENDYMELSISLHGIHKISDCLHEWESAASIGDQTEYERCRHLFLSIIEQILRAESVAASNWI